MASAGRQLLDLLDADDPFGFPDDEILPLQIAAAHESFERLRALIALLDSRAKEAGIDEIALLDDAVGFASVATQTVGVFPSERKAALRDGLVARGVRRVLALGRAGTATGDCRTTASSPCTGSCAG